MSARGATYAAQRLTKTAHRVTKPVDLSDKDARLPHSFEERSHKVTDRVRKTILVRTMSCATLGENNSRLALFWRPAHLRCGPRDQDSGGHRHHNGPRRSLPRHRAK